MLDKNNKEAIQLLIDTHNETNEDALRLISEHYFDIKDSVKTKIYGISEREISFLLTMPTKKIYQTIRFPREVKSSNEISTFFIKILNQAREKAPKNYPKTRIEGLIEKTLNLETYITKVTSKRVISSNMIEITFKGGLEDLPDLKNDSFMYFIVHKDIKHNYPHNFTMQKFRELGAGKENPYSGAYYTIRNFREDEIDVWFVLHENPGSLANWAEKVGKDDKVAIWGPRTTFSPPEATKNYLFIADETAQPAVLSSIENLAEGSEYKCFFETQDETSQFKYKFAENHIEWIHRKKEKPGQGTELEKTLSQLELDNENLYVFGAGEAKQMSIIRKLFKEKHGLKASQINFTGYWRKTI